jgi:RNA polymerase sigma factor (sigma-70 family)
VALTDEQYQELYIRLRRFFAWNRCPSPEDYAQESILRGLRRMDEGQFNYGANPFSYFMGIARNVLREHRKKREPEAIDEQTAVSTAEAAAIQWRILLGECLSRLSRDERRILETYILEGVAVAAKEFGISENAVRIRVSRIRDKVTRSLRGPADFRK